MAVLVRLAGQGIPTDIRFRYADMGDGTHALVGAAVQVADNDPEALLVNTAGVPLSVDRVTNGLQNITTDHAAIHEKLGYSAYITFAAVPNGATRNIVMTTAATRYVHLKFYDIWISNASGTWQTYENPQSVAGGTAVTPVNRNRLGTPPTSAETLVHTAAVNLAGATLLETLNFGGGGTGPQGRAGGDRSTDIEWVLRQSENYVFLITNTSGVAADIGVWLFWYEEGAG